MDQSYSKKEKLKSKILITQLFTEGKSIKKYPLKLVYLPLSGPRIGTHQAGVSVPKRNFKRAVDRIHIKRLMREAFRKNKYLVVDQHPSFAFMFLYIGREQEDYHKIFSSTEALLKTFAGRDKT